MPADQTSARRHAATSQHYDLHHKAAGVVASHDTFTAAFAGYAVQMADCRMTGHPAPPQVTPSLPSPPPPVLASAATSMPTLCFLAGCAFTNASWPSDAPVMTPATSAMGLLLPLC